MNHRAVLIVVFALASHALAGCGGDSRTPCTSAGDCTNQVCGPDGYCQSGRIGDPCASDSHCDVGGSTPTYCATTLGHCVLDARTCQGSAGTCSYLNATECGSTLGCSGGYGCSGYASDCILFDYLAGSCGSQDGCTYNYSNSWCNGTAWQCGSYASSGSCVLQDGCSWTFDCSGTPTPCSALSRSTCESQIGCYLQ